MGPSYKMIAEALYCEFGVKTSIFGLQSTVDKHTAMKLSIFETACNNFSLDDYMKENLYKN